MTFLDVLTLAYGLTGVIALCGYLPQFRAYITNKRSCKDAPLATWALWSLQSCIVVTYAGLVNGDAVFIFSGGLVGFANVLGLSLVMWGRWRQPQRPTAVIVSFPRQPHGRRPRRVAA